MVCLYLIIIIFILAPWKVIFRNIGLHIKSVCPSNDFQYCSLVWFDWLVMCVLRAGNFCWLTNLTINQTGENNACFYMVSSFRSHKHPWKYYFLKGKRISIFHEVVAKLLQVFVSSPSSNAMNDLHAGSRVV